MVAMPVIPTEAGALWAQPSQVYILSSSQPGLHGEFVCCIHIISSHTDLYSIYSISLFPCPWCLSQWQCRCQTSSHAMLVTCVFTMLLSSSGYGHRLLPLCPSHQNIQYVSNVLQVCSTKASTMTCLSVCADLPCWVPCLALSTKQDKQWERPRRRSSLWVQLHSWHTLNSWSAYTCEF